MKVYNFATEEQDRTPKGEVQYEVFKTGTAEPIVSTTDDVAKLPKASASQVTLQKFLRLGKLRQALILYG